MQDDKLGFDEVYKLRIFKGSLLEGAVERSETEGEMPRKGRTFRSLPPSRLRRATSLKEGGF